MATCLAWGCCNHSLINEQHCVLFTDEYHCCLWTNDKYDSFQGDTTWQLISLSIILPPLQGIIVWRDIMFGQWAALVHFVDYLTAVWYVNQVVLAVIQPLVQHWHTVPEGQCLATCITVSIVKAFQMKM